MFRPTTVTPLLALLLGLAAFPARAADDVALKVETGWGESLRPGRWTPVFVTLAEPLGSASKPRAVRIELEVPQGGPNTMRVEQYATVGPSAVTYALYVPVRNDGGDGLAVTVRDAASGRTLTRWPVDDSQSYLSYRRFNDAEKPMIGVAGERSRLEELVQAASYGGNDRVPVVQLASNLLPDQPAGYDLLDLLVLNRLDLNRVGAEQQRAIADWVRAGGCLLVWPGEDPIPDGPVADILPCKVGQPRGYAVAPLARWRAAGQQLDAATGRELRPVPGAEPVPLFAGSAGTSGDTRGIDLTAYTRRVGFGRVVMMPFDPNHLAFKDTGERWKFYARLTDRMGIVPADQKAEDDSSARYRYSSYGADPMVARQDGAVTSLQDHLGNVPGAGRFGFSYVAWVVIGMMVLVGPVDWFVLKLLGRQPWTWVTTAGWIGLITAGALFIANVFKSGDLHYNTVELLDQADDRTIARVTLAGIYAPRTATYHVDAAATERDAGGNPVATNQPPPGWWDLAAVGYGYGRGMRFDSRFRQTTEGNIPQPMTINVWNLRFLRGEQATDGAPVIAADLRARKAGGTTVIEGTIKNVSGRALTDVRVQAGKRFAGPAGSSAGEVAPAGQPATAQDAELAARKIVEPGVDLSRSAWGAMIRSPVLVPRLGPGESATVRAEVRTPAGAGAKPDDDEKVSRAPRYNYGGETPAPAARDVWAIVGDLAGRRAARAAAEAAADDHAVVYAQVADPQPTAVIREPNAHQKHVAVVRALVKLRPAEK